MNFEFGSRTRLLDKLAVSPPSRTSPRRNQYFTGASALNLSHTAARQPLCRREAGELTVLITQQTALDGADPERAVRIFVQIGAIVGAHAGRIALVEDGEAHAVK